MILNENLILSQNVNVSYDFNNYNKNCSNTILVSIMTTSMINRSEALEKNVLPLKLATLGTSVLIVSAFKYDSAYNKPSRVDPTLPIGYKDKYVTGNMDKSDVMSKTPFFILP